MSEGCEQLTQSFGQTLKKRELTEKQVEYVARLCHEVNRAVCMVNGDGSQVAWEDAPDWQKQSAMDGVRKAVVAPFLSPAENHEGWMEIKLRDGWRYGPIKDASQKVHPCLLPYKSLPPHEKIKDQIFMAVVNGYLNCGAPE